LPDFRASRLRHLSPREHLANIQTAKHILALLNHEIELIQTNKLAEAATVDEATGSLNDLREQFESRYSLRPCR
jgi:hypothetical protein